MVTRTLTSVTGGVRLSVISMWSTKIFVSIVMSPKSFVASRGMTTKSPAFGLGRGGGSMRMVSESKKKPFAARCTLVVGDPDAAVGHGAVRIVAMMPGG